MDIFFQMANEQLDDLYASNAPIISTHKLKCSLANLKTTTLKYPSNVICGNHICIFFFFLE